MTTYIALLRGINVGGKNIIRMAELKKSFEDTGLSEVKTYIQSGNVLFKSNKEHKELKEIIEHKIKTSFGFPVAVVLRTADEMEKIISNCPFSMEEIREAESSTDTECLYVSLLNKIPLSKNIDIFNNYRSESDDYRIVGRDVFLLFRHSIRNSKLAGNLNKLDASATVRNWKTLNKLVELAKGMDAGGKVK